MTYQDDNPNRPVHDPYARRSMANRGSMGWALPAIVVAVLVLGGMALYSASDKTTTTASNTTPTATTQTSPSGPARTTPAPTPTPPTKTQ
jgi:hypothetical protein